jgi:hypothetical protein
MRNEFICDLAMTGEIQINMARGGQRGNSVLKGFVESVFEREGLLEFHFSIAPGERRDLFGESHESHFLLPCETGIDETVELAWERRECHCWDESLASLR